MYNALVYKVMIASPGDVPQERNIAREVINEWNGIHSEDKNVVLLSVGWKTHSSPQMGDRAQSIINNQVLKDCDLLVAVFWTRLGSPTGISTSGTVEEIEEHINSGKCAMVYFSSAPVRLDSVDSQQYEALKQFKELCKSKGLVEHYEDIADFRRKFSRQLAQTVLREFSDENQFSPSDLNTSFERNLNLSEAANELLSEAIKDPNGRILRMETFAGIFIRTKNRDFVEVGNVRSEAKWKAALEELHLTFLVETENDQVYTVTNAGYEYADQQQLNIGP